MAGTLRKGKKKARIAGKGILLAVSQLQKRKERGNGSNRPLQNLPSTQAVLTTKVPLDVCVAGAGGGGLGRGTS